MSSKRTYGDRCGVARALDLVGERWALLIVRELLLGPKRFTDLRAGLPNVGPDILSARLRELEEAAIVRRLTLPPPAGSRVYELTDRGQELESVVLALGRWGSRAAIPGESAVFGIDSAMLALKTLFAPSASEGLDATYEVKLSDQTFRADIRDRRLELTRGSAERPDLVIESDPSTLGGLLWHRRDLTEALRSGDIVLTGKRALARRFFHLFPLPS